MTYGTERRIEMSTAFEVLAALHTLLKEDDIHSFISHDDHERYRLRFGFQYKYAVLINGQMLHVTKMDGNRREAIGKPTEYEVFSIDLTAPDSVEKFTTWVRDLLGGEGHKSHDLN